MDGDDQADPTRPSPAELSPPQSPPPGWYPDPQRAGTQRWWDGRRWSEQIAPGSAPTGTTGPAAQAYLAPSPQPKSPGIALLLTILFPGAGHAYIGQTDKAVGHLIANSIGLFCALTLILFPVAVVIWIVTVLMAAPGIGRETEQVNLARGLPPRPA